jgi:hypothetical protein
MRPSRDRPKVSVQYRTSAGHTPRLCSRGGIVESKRVELLLKIIAEELYWARRDRALDNGTADVTNEDELFRDGAFANIDLLRREVGL